MMPRVPSMETQCTHTTHDLVYAFDSLSYVAERLMHTISTGIVRCLSAIACIYPRKTCSIYEKRSQDD